MTEKSKITTFTFQPQIAGMTPGDVGIEFGGIRKTKQAYWLQNGNTHYFHDLPNEVMQALKTSYLSKPKAVEYLNCITTDPKRQVELFTYYMYGDLDGTPDYINGKLSEPENFRDIANCPSLLWEGKDLVIKNHVLTPRQIMIIDHMWCGLPNKTIAASLGIAEKTLDNHNQKLYTAIGAQSKSDVLRLAVQYKIVA